MAIHRRPVGGGASCLRCRYPRTLAGGDRGGAGENLVSERVFSELDDGNGNGGLETAPVVIIVCLDTAKLSAVHGASSIYPAVQNLLLTAAALGYGSCLTTGLTTGSAALVRELLKLPEQLELMAAVFIGRPARVLGPPRRQPAEEFTHREVFGSPWKSEAQ